MPNDFTLEDLIPERIVVSAEAYDALVALLDAEPEPTPRLDALLSEPSRLDTPDTGV